LVLKGYKDVREVASVEIGLSLLELVKFLGLGCEMAVVGLDTVWATVGFSVHDGTDAQRFSAAEILVWCLILKT